MQTEMTLYEAWDDFMKNVYPDLSLERRDRESIWKADQARRGHTKYPLGKARVKKYLSKHAPDRYEFVETTIVIVSGDTSDSNETR